MMPYTYLQLLFFITELTLLIFRRAKSEKVKTSLDRSSLLLLWAMIALGSALAPGIAMWCPVGLNNWYAVEISGIIVFVTGFVIRWAAVYQLGKLFTVNVSIADEHTLKTNGLYKIIRHPSYLGLLLIITGLGLSLNSLLSLLVIFIPAFVVVNYRISVEEQALTAEFGEQYVEYKKRVKKLIPGIY